MRRLNVKRYQDYMYRGKKEGKIKEKSNVSLCSFSAHLRFALIQDALKSCTRKIDKTMIGEERRYFFYHYQLIFLVCEKRSFNSIFVLNFLI